MGDCAIISISKNNKQEVISYYSDSMDNINSPEIFKIKISDITSIEDFRFLKRPEDYKFLKSNTNLVPLGSVCKFYNGIKTGDNKKFLSEKKISKSYKPIVRGKDFSRYSIINQQMFVLFDPKQLWSNCNESILSVHPKIIIRQTGDTITGTLDDSGIFPMDTVHMIYESEIDLFSLLGVINSEIFNELHKALVPETGKAFAEVKIANLKKINIPKPELINKRNDLKELVEAVLSDNMKLSNEVSESMQEQIIKKVNYIQDKINIIVKELYGF